MGKIFEIINQLSSYHSADEMIDNHFGEGNEVNCGIFQDITKRFRNAFHLCGMTNVKKAIAFTLAETLIVMGIIGIVSALTLPNLNSSTGEKEKIAKVKKIYQNLDDALSRAHAIYGPQDEWYSGKTEAERNQIFFERVTEFMKVSKTCSPNTTGCMTKSTGNGLNTGYTVTDTTQKYYQAILADGTSVSFFPYGSDGCSENYCSTLYVDIDGPSKGSFTYGKDLFIFVGTNKEGLYQGWSLSTTEMAKCFKWGNTCSAWVMQTDNMDYLNTDVNGKCKNNSNLTLNLFASPAVTSCK